MRLKINWNHDCANRPDLGVDEELPGIEEFRFEILGEEIISKEFLQRIYYGEVGVHCAWFCQRERIIGMLFGCIQTAIVQDTGYGGVHVPIQMKDGRKVTLKGPWSSRAGAMNLFLQNQGRDRVVDGASGRGQKAPAVEEWLTGAGIGYKWGLHFEEKEPNLDILYPWKEGELR